MGLARTIIETCSQGIGKARRGQRVRTPVGQGPVRVNLGCGLAVAPGWINVDGSLNALLANAPAPLHRLAYRLTGAKAYYSESHYCRLLGEHTFVHHDLSHGVPFDDAAVDFIYTSHFLEHMERAEGQRLLDESRRVLRPGGTIRVSVPDLDHAIGLYQAGKKAEMLNGYFYVDDGGSHYARHKYMYDFSLLSEALKRAGFVDVRRCAFRQGVTPDLELLDSREDESLFVEATR